MIKSAKNKLLIIISFLLGLINSVYGQIENTQEVELKKNAVYGNIGIGPVYFTGTGYYERIITQNNKISSFAKVGIGGYAIWGTGGQYILAQYGILTGAKKHHLELGAGPAYFISGDLKEGEPPFTATIGWRNQKPGGRFMFRMGASWPEALYIGLGVSL